MKRAKRHTITIHPKGNLNTASIQLHRPAERSCCEIGMIVATAHMEMNAAIKRRDKLVCLPIHSYALN